jgi:alpha-mannosidase
VREPGATKDSQQTTILCDGLPYHRRPGPRKLDTLLITKGETARTFRLGIAIDVPNPLAAALGFLAPPLVLPDQPPPPAPTGWFFHLDCRNVLATHWDPLSASDLSNSSDNSRGLTAPGPTAPGPTVSDPTAPAEFFETLPSTAEPAPAPQSGFRVRLLETDGRSVRFGLRCFRSVASARKLNPGGVPSMDLEISGDRIDIPLGPHQWIEVEARFVAS